MQTNIFKLSNPYFFWILIMVLIFTAIASNEYFSIKEIINNKSSIIEQSYNDKSSESYVIDLENLHTNDLLYTSSIFETSYKKLLPTNITTISFYIYTALISLLFIYREKQNRIKLMLLEKQEDSLQIELAKQSDISIYTEVEEEIRKYHKVFTPELDANTFKTLLDISPIAIIAASRVITEKLITNIYDEHFAYEKPFALRIVALQKSNYITFDMSNLAHTIKAFGNKAAHPNPTVLTKKDALLVISSLLHLIEKLESANLLKNQ